jgi:ArsR family transcriptional regulator, arsenate/arsenite/antimonite-responsive transcriptional repressor
VVRPKRTSNGELPARQVRAISRVLSDPRRFEILKHIAANPCTACSDLRGAFPITPPTLSHHLKELESAGLIETARRGKFVDVAFQRDTWDAYMAELRKI